MVVGSASAIPCGLARGPRVETSSCFRSSWRSGWPCSGRRSISW